MKAFITGGSGFIGSHLADRLIKENNKVTIFDNFSTGNKKFLEQLMSNKNLNIIQGDILDYDFLKDSINDHDIVFHLSANADVRFGLESPKKDLEQNTIGTSNILEAMRINNIKKVVFSSTGSVYGDCREIPTSESCPFPIQTSLYASSKLAGEALISSYCFGYDFQSWIFRFVSILGERYSHGHVFDFYKQLKEHPDQLNVLGNGHQKKSYLYIDDCIDAILLSIEKSEDKINLYNLGTDEFCEVRDSIKWICNELRLKPKLNFTGGERGWIGDNPFIFLDTKKIRSLGWKPKLNIENSIIKTVQYLDQNNWIFQSRK